MKKIFTFIVAALTFVGSAQALENVPQPGLSFKGQFGMNISNFRGVDTNAKVGFNLGVQAEYMFPSCYGVFANLGANYTMKGAKLDFIHGENGATGTLAYRPCYVEIPLHVGYRYDITSSFGVYADFGPYIAIGTNGKSVMDYDSDAYDKEKTRFFRNANNTIGDIQRFDFGLGFRVGAEYANHHSLTLCMDWGLTDMYRHDYRKAFLEQYHFELNKLKTFNCSISYGYRF